MTDPGQGCRVGRHPQLVGRVVSDAKSRIPGCTTGDVPDLASSDYAFGCGTMRI